MTCTAQRRAGKDPSLRRRPWDASGRSDPQAVVFAKALVGLGASGSDRGPAADQKRRRTIDNRSRSVSSAERKGPSRASRTAELLNPRVRRICGAGSRSWGRSWLAPAPTCDRCGRNARFHHCGRSDTRPHVSRMPEGGRGSSLSQLRCRWEADSMLSSSFSASNLLRFWRGAVESFSPP